MSAEPPHRLEDLSVRALKDLLQQQEISFADCVEKAHLIERLWESSAPPVTDADDEAAAEPAADTEPEAPSTPSVAPEPPKQPKGKACDAWKNWKGGRGGGAGSWGQWEKKKKSDASRQQEGGGDGVDWPWLTKALSWRLRLRGTVKLCDPEKAFCFVACEETKAIFHRDVFVGAQDFGDVVPVVGDKVNFFLGLNGRSQPRGFEVRMEQACTEARLPEWRKVLDPDAVYLGSIKSFQEDTGFGFIACPELREVFERDVFLHHSQLAGFSAGDQVSFRINVDPLKGTPKAKNLTAPDAQEVAACEDAQRGEDAQPLAADAAQAGPPPPPSRPLDEEDSEEEVLAGWGGLKLPPTEAGCREEGDTTTSGEATEESRASDSPEASLVEEMEAAEQEPKAPCSGTPGAGPGPWKRYTLEEGAQAYWWCEGDDDWFVEGSPEPWMKYQDPVTKGIYWWKGESRWFWA